MDGNNSLKRMATAAHRMAGDTRSLDDSDYFLPCEYVDRFANEVRGKGMKGPAVKRRRNDSDEESEEEEGESGGDEFHGKRGENLGTGR